MLHSVSCIKIQRVISLMTEYIFLPEIPLEAAVVHPEHKKWLVSWLKEVEGNIEDGNVSSSMCIQGIIAEIALFKSIKTDWYGIVNEYLTDDRGFPIAYSEEYGKRLYSFNQWLQKPLHAIYTKWWIEKILNKQKDNDIQYGTLIQSLIQPDGWMYNPDVSCTGSRTRMRSELLMSMAMGIEILDDNNLLTGHKKQFQATISSFPLSHCLSAEYFRLRALKKLDSIELSPVGYNNMLKMCEAGAGYCDFSLETKVDDYMGTAKRTSRDKLVHSPLASLFAIHIASACEKSVKEYVMSRVNRFREYLKKNPFDIPSFIMRDINIPFGSDLTPLEIIAASAMIGSGEKGLKMSKSNK